MNWNSKSLKTKELQFSMLSRKVFKTLISLHTAKYRTITSDEVQHDINVRTREAGYIPAAVTVDKKMPKSQRRARNDVSGKKAMTKRAPTWYGAKSFFKY